MKALRFAALAGLVGGAMLVASVATSSSASAFGRFGSPVHYTVKNGGWQCASPTYPGKPQKHWERRKAHYKHFRQVVRNHHYGSSNKRSFRR